MDAKRFDVELEMIYGGGGAIATQRDPGLRFDEHPQGKYVLAADHLAAREADRVEIERLSDRLKTAEALLKRARDRYEGGQLVGRDWADHASAFLRGDE